MSEPQLIDLIDFCFKKLYGQSVTEQIIRNWIREYSQKEGL